MSPPHQNEIYKKLKIIFAFYLLYQNIYFSFVASTNTLTQHLQFYPLYEETPNLTSIV